MSTEDCPQRGEWTRLLHDALTDDRQRQLEVHLERCPECRRQLDEIAGVLPLTPESVPAEGVGATLLESVMRKLVTPGTPPGSEGNSAGGTSHPEVLELPPGMLEPPTRRGSLGRIGHFDVLSVIGRGGLGAVLRAFDPKLNRIVAIKIPAPELVANAMVRRRFQREAQAAAAVTSDHVVRIYAVDEARSIPFLVMEFVDGGSLQQEIDRRGALDVKQVVRVGMQLAQGLAAAHKQGLVHRDIKPANILLDGGLERVKLTDFGLARAIDDATLTQSGVVAGTPQYMSPEQARGETVDSRSDLFSLGSVLYTMCTGRPAFRAETPLAVLRRIVDDEPRPLRQINPEIPSWLAEIVETLLRKHPEERYQTAEEVGSALESWLAHLQQPQVAAPIETFLPDNGLRDAARVARPSPTRRQGPALWIVLSLLPISVGVGLVFLLLLLKVRVQQSTAEAYPALVESTHIPGATELNVQIRGGGDRLELTNESRPDLVPYVFPLNAPHSQPGLISASRDQQEMKLTLLLPAGRYRARVLKGQGHETKVLVEQMFDTRAANGDAVGLLLNSADEKSISAPPLQFPLEKTAEGGVFRLPAQVSSVVFLPDDRSLLAGTWGNGVHYLAMNTADTAGTRQRVLPPQRIQVGRDGPTVQLSLSGGAGADWNGIFPEAPRHVSRLTQIADGRIAVAGEEGVFQLRDLADSRSVQRFSGHSGIVRCFTHASDVPVFSSGGAGGNVLVWHVDRGLLAMIDTEEEIIYGLALSPDGKTLITSGKSGKLMVWDVATRAKQQEKTIHAATGIAFVSNGTEVLSAGSDFRTYRWSFPEFKMKQHYSGHTGVITTLAVDERHRRIATGSDDLTVRLWDMDSAQALAVFPGHQKKISEVAFSPDGRWLASSSEDATVRLWKLPGVESAEAFLEGEGEAQAEGVAEAKDDRPVEAELPLNVDSTRPAAAPAGDRPEGIPLPTPTGNTP